MRQVFQNLSVALAAAGSGMAQVVKLTVYLTDLADLGCSPSKPKTHIERIVERVVAR